MTGPTNSHTPSTPQPMTPQSMTPQPMAADTTREFSRPRLDGPGNAPGGSGPGFHVGWRGYDRRQVDMYRSQIEAALGATRDAHERAVRAHAETSERLRVMQNELLRARAQSTNSPSALSDRLREILDLAAQEAHQIRADAKADAEQAQTVARNEADRTRAKASNDAQVVMRQARKSAEDMASSARAGQTRLTGELEQARTAFEQSRKKAEAEVRQAREHADAQASARREAADTKAKAQRDEADAAASARLAEMDQKLADLRRHRDEAHAALHQLHQSVRTTLDAAATTAPKGSKRSASEADRTPQYEPRPAR